MPARLHLEGFDQSELLDQSSQGSLWRARSLERPVLIRVYPAEAWTEPDNLRLQQGIGRLERLDHPAIPRPLANLQSQEALCLVFPDPSSWTLREHLQGQPMDPLEAAETVLQVAEALQTAHGGGLAHGHLNPDTIRITPETGRVLLLGLETGQPLPGAPLDAAGDLRALGEVLAFLLTAQDPPPEGPALRHACPDLPCELEWITAQLRRAGTPQGYRSADEAVEDLEAWLDQKLLVGAPRSTSPSPDLTSLWADIETGDSVSQDEPSRLRWLVPAFLGLLAWLGWLVVPSWKTPQAGPPPDELVYYSLAEQDEETTHPGYGILDLQVQGLSPAETTVRLKIRDGDQVIHEAELPAGQGLVEIPKGRLLTLEIAADLHNTRTRTLLLEPGRGRVSLKTVLVRHTEVTVSTIPGALVRLDRLPVGQADGKGILMLPPGTLEVGRVCLLSASKVGYEPREERFTVKTGHTVILLDLAPLKTVGRPGRPEPPSETTPPLPAVPTPETPSASGTSTSEPARATQAPPAPRSSPTVQHPPSAPKAPAFPQIPPAPPRNLPSTAKDPDAPPQTPAPGPPPAAEPTQTPTPGTPPPAPALSLPSGDSDLPVLLPDN
ncbi:MAG: hypothetical protein ACOX9B_13995 [Candidatus Xenobium sp.]|nr:hypothetical protein [Burkholderiales bacterium]